MSYQLRRLAASRARHVVAGIELRGKISLILRDTAGSRALKYFCVRVAQLDGDIVHLLAGELYCVDTG